jgi:hypothetical protein
MAFNPSADMLSVLDICKADQFSSGLIIDNRSPEIFIPTIGTHVITKLLDPDVDTLVVPLLMRDNTPLKSVSNLIEALKWEHRCDNGSLQGSHLVKYKNTLLGEFYTGRGIILNDKKDPIFIAGIKYKKVFDEHENKTFLDAIEPAIYIDKRVVCEKNALYASLKRLIFKIPTVEAAYNSASSFHNVRALTSCSDDITVHICSLEDMYYHSEYIESPELMNEDVNWLIHIKASSIVEEFRFRYLR